MVCARPSPPAQHHALSVLLSSLQVPSSEGLCIEPPVRFAELFASRSAPPVSPERELSPWGGAAHPAPLACTLLLRPSSPSQLAGNTGFGVSSLLCSGQVPAPRLCQHQQGLNRAPCMGLGCACNPHPSPKPNNTSRSPLGWACLRMNNSHTSLSFQSYLHLHLTGSALNAEFAWLF